jgi:hypothetical protein
MVNPEIQNRLRFLTETRLVERPDESVIVQIHYKLRTGKADSKSGSQKASPLTTLPQPSHFIILNRCWSLESDRAREFSG